MTTRSSRAARLTLRPQTVRAMRMVLGAAAVLGTLLGVQTLVLHATTDPFNDLRVYYDAGARLNAGLPLYNVGATDSEGLYLNPPLLAIMFRPLALLPFSVVAVAWALLSVGAVIAVLRRAGLGVPVLILTGCVAPAIAWSLAVGQVEPLLTLLLTVGSPAAIALAANLKLFPILVAVYWVRRRDARALAIVAGVAAALGVIQLVVAPTDTLQWLQLSWLGPAFEVRSISPFRIHPALWVAFVIGLAIVALREGRGRYGWAAAVSLAVFAYPRLLLYQLMTLLAVFGGPGESSPTDGERA